jgi:hypothetical protein
MGKKSSATEETAEVVAVEAVPEPTEAPAAAPPAPPPAPEIRTVEEWATRKGMLPKRRPIAAPFARKGAALREELNPLFLSFAQAQAQFSWPIGKELTEADFDAAVITATTNVYR